MSKRPAYESLATQGQLKMPSGNPANIRLDSVNPIWLDAPGSLEQDRFLLLEDPETGDVHMPLMYMKRILGSNYSRKLSALKHRLVTVPPNSTLARDPRHKDLLYWHWAFEAPHPIKLIVREHIGENTPQGHLRLVLLPIVYNALVDRPELHNDPLFLALHRAMRHSTYWPYLCIQQELVTHLDIMSQCVVPVQQIEEQGLDSQQQQQQPQSQSQEQQQLLQGAEAAAPAVDLPNSEVPTLMTTPPSVQKVFNGPRVLESTACKYMFMFRDQKEIEASKKARTTNAVVATNGLLTATVLGGPSRQKSAPPDGTEGGDDQHAGQYQYEGAEGEGIEHHLQRYQLLHQLQREGDGEDAGIVAPGAAAGEAGIDASITEFIRQTVSRAVDIKFAPMLQEQQYLKQTVLHLYSGFGSLMAHLPSSLLTPGPEALHAYQIVHGGGGGGGGGVDAVDVPPGGEGIQEAVHQALNTVMDERMMAQQLGFPYPNQATATDPPSLPRVDAPSSQNQVADFNWPVPKDTSQAAAPGGGGGDEAAAAGGGGGGNGTNAAADPSGAAPPPALSINDLGADSSKTLSLLLEKGLGSNLMSNDSLKLGELVKNLHGEDVAKLLSVTNLSFPHSLLNGDLSFLAEAAAKAASQEGDQGQNKAPSHVDAAVVEAAADGGEGDGDAMQIDGSRPAEKQVAAAFHAGAEQNETAKDSPVEEDDEATQ